MERWDIYDINKRKTGRTMARNDWTMRPGDYHLTVLGIVTNKAGQFLITRRKMDKEWAPGAFEVSGGGVQAGETSLEAVKREVSEETGLDVSRAEISLFCTRTEMTVPANGTIILWTFIISVWILLRRTSTRRNRKRTASGSQTTKRSNVLADGAVPAL